MVNYRPFETPAPMASVNGGHALGSTKLRPSTIFRVKEVEESKEGEISKNFRRSTKFQSFNKESIIFKKSRPISDRSSITEVIPIARRKICTEKVRLQKESFLKTDQLDFFRKKMHGLV